MAGKKPAKIANRNAGIGGKTEAIDPTSRYVVVQVADHTKSKYGTPTEGFALDHALMLAGHAHPDQPEYHVITLAQYQEAVTSA